MYDPIKEKEECELLCKNLFHKINGADDMFTEVLMKHILSEHRTLQQSFWRMITKLIIQTAKTEYYDLRNEASIEMCKEIVLKLKEKLYLPLI
jgi:hypothetical protein